MKISSATLRFLSVIVIVGPIVFLLIALRLQTLQTSYAPREQFISELALGAHGVLLQWAFYALGLSWAALVCTIRHFFDMPYKHMAVLRGALSVAGIAFSLAGFFTLGTYDTLHIALIFVAFMAAVIGMLFFYDQCDQVFKASKSSRAFFLRLICTVALCVTGAGLLFSAMEVYPFGMAQRMSAVGVLGWLLIMGLSLLIQPLIRECVACTQSIVMEPLCRHAPLKREAVSSDARHKRAAVSL